MSRFARFTRIAAAAALSLAAMSPALSAQPHDPAPHADFFQHMLQKMDTNGDGRISLDEYLAVAGTRFESLDAQHKGAVDAADIASSPPALARMDHRAQALVKHLDTAGNGYVTEAEFVAAAQNRFARLDRNSNGKLTPDELAGAGRDRPRAAIAGPRSAAFAQHRFERLDANHDGVVTLDEYLAAAKALYAKFDAQHDGKVTADEMASSPRAQQRAVRAADRLVRRLDANADGIVSRDEFVAAAKARFARLDRNGDGFIDAGEAAGRRWTRRGH